MEAIIVSVVTSLIASLIFWLVFDFIPSKVKYNRIRPKVEFDIYEIYFKLLFYIETPLQTNIYGCFYPQKRLSAGLVSRDEFKLWLQNKCLNSTYMFDEMGDKLIPIGSKLEELSKDICSKIEKCSTYYSFMTAEEILLLQKISVKLTVYSYTGNATETVGQHTLRPLIPNLSYMAENFYEISQLFVKLQGIVWKYKKIDTSTNKYIVHDFKPDKARNAYLHGAYRKCICLLKSRMLSDPEKTYPLLFQSYYALGKKKKALTYLRKYVGTTSLTPVSYRYIFEDIYKSENGLSTDILEILLQYYSDVEILEMVNEILQKQQILDEAIKLNQEIALFYASKRDQHDIAAQEKGAKKRKAMEDRISQLQNNIPAD